MAKFKTYTIANDTANGVLDTLALDDQLKKDPTLSDIYDGINRTQGSGEFSCHVIVERTTQIDTAMDAIVNAHDGSELVEESVSVVVESQQPFASKTLSNGKKLYSRVTGEVFSLSTGSNTDEHVIAYPQIKFNELEIIGGEIGDKVNLKILDTASGSYTTVPNYQLNQFGFSVNVAKDFYSRSSNYDADLYLGMRIVLEYTSISDKDIYVNFIIHEVKD